MEGVCSLEYYIHRCPDGFDAGAVIESLDIILLWKGTEASYWVFFMLAAHWFFLFQMLFLIVSICSVLHIGRIVVFVRVITNLKCLLIGRG